MKINFDEDLESLIMWAEDTINPALATLSLKAQIREFQQDIYELEKVKGESEKSKSSKERFEKMLETCEYLDKVANQNATFQTILRHNNGKLAVANRELTELRTKLEGIEKAWKAE